jgi:VanZ family protein
MEERTTEIARQEHGTLWDWRWPIWGIYTVAWSMALLVPNPVYLVLSHGPGGKKIDPALEWGLFLFAKTLHVMAYALAAVLTGWLRAPGRWRWVLLAFWSLHACGTEFGQLFVPTRTGSLRDVGLDHLGLLIGVALTWRWWRPAVKS